MKTQVTFIYAFFLLSMLYGNEIPKGYVIAWGENAAGEVTGVPHSGYATGLVAVAGQVLDDATNISAGGNHCLAIKSDGTVVGWGWNGDGKATPPANLDNVISVAAGGEHSLALKKNGTVVAWGNHQFAVRKGLSNVVAIAAGFQSCLALKKDGTIIGWGDHVRIPASLTNIVAISSSAAFLHEYYLGLKKDGTVVAWNNSNSEVHTRAGLSNVVAIAAGAMHNLALKKDGTVVAWGFNGDGETNVPVGLSNVVAIAASGNDFPASGYSLALKSDGTVVAWGRMGVHPATVPAGLSNVVAISARGICLAITTSKTVADKFSKK